MEWDTSDDGMDGWTLMNIINHALHLTCISPGRFGSVILFRESCTWSRKGVQYAITWVMIQICGANTSTYFDQERFPRMNE